MPALYQMRITDEEDFIFQVNRPHLVSDIRMNCITKWSADRFQLFNMTVPIGAPVQWQIGQASMSLQPTDFFGASVTFDHNNAPVQAPLSRDQQVVLLTEGLSRAGRMQREYGMNIVGF
jgi:hypothetical protein